MKDISFEKIENPKVSIIIPLYGQVNYTLDCLRSLSKVNDSTTFEVICVDDCSPDNTEEIIPTIPGVIYKKNEVNSGFVKTINHGIKVSKGEYVYLLNNDTKVADHFLETLLSVFEKFDNVGAVVSKLILSDGKLQEGGSIIYTNGLGANYGKNFGDPNDYRVNFIRQIDYGAAAALLVKRDVLDKIGGGLDEDLAPAYYEDTELCINLRRHGYRVMYQPKSIVYHYEGLSYGRDKSQMRKTFSNKVVKKTKLIIKKILNIKEPAPKSFLENLAVEAKTNRKAKLMLTNREKLLKKHQDYMNQVLWEDDGELSLDIKSFSKDKKHIFFFEEKLIEPDKHAGALRCFNLLKILKDYYHVTLIVKDQTYDAKYYDMLTQEGIRVLMNIDANPKIDWKKFLEENINYVEAFILSRPDAAIYFYPEIKRILAKTNAKVKVIYDTVDLHFNRIKMQREEAEKATDKDKEARIAYLNKAYENYRALETYFIQDTDETWVVTIDEKDYLVNYGLKSAKNIKIVPIIWDVQATENSYAKRKDMLFIGWFKHTPNIDAIVYYYDKIIPELKKRNIKIKLQVIGDNNELLPSHIKNNEYIELLGYVEDPTSYFNSCLIAFYPLTYGAGMKGKITHALALGLPVITTDIGAQGHVDAQKFMVVGNSVTELVDGIEKYLKDQNLWENNREKGFQFIIDHMSFDAVVKIVKNI